MTRLKDYLVKGSVIAAVLLGTTACSVINLSDLGIPNPFGGNEEVPPAADPTTDASTYLGPTPNDVAAGGGFQTGFDNNVGGTNFGVNPTAIGGANVAPGSDPRPADSTAARAYDMIVQRAQANCPVAPQIIGFGRVAGGYNANASCPSTVNAGGALATPYNTIGFQ